MKKIFAIAITVFISYSSYAQGPALFENATNVVNLGIGVGDVFWGAGYSGAPVSFNASFDRGVTDKLGIGYIGAGGIIGYTSRTYNTYSNGITYKTRYSGLLIGVRATYHFALNGEISEKLDPYAGLVAGYVITSHSGDENPYYNGPSAFRPGAFAGAHYYFSPNFGAFAEVGYNVISVLNTGLTIKF
ncbi:MAG: hypothetical protein JST47_11830 [Bacteroidetes bacterium]|nr:hypothetical protein [Bacteroidota bacterium]